MRDASEKRIGLVAGCSTNREALAFARDNWPNHVVTRVRKGEGMHHEVYGRPRRRRV